MVIDDTKVLSPPLTAFVTAKRPAMDVPVSVIWMLLFMLLARSLPYWPPVLGPWDCPLFFSIKLIVKLPVYLATSRYPPTS